jgi:EAL domain-containing protein (putative c-di-GMP-specific phosphodiesterase class I)
LRALGCDLGQGYFIARPLEAERAAAFLLRDSTNAAIEAIAPRAALPAARATSAIAVA